MNGNMHGVFRIYLGSIRYSVPIIQTLGYRNVEFEKRNNVPDRAH